MANSFSKEERVAFDEVLDGFEDQLVMSRLVRKYRTNQTDMERSNDTIWRPQPYIGVSYEGSDATPNFGGDTQLSVPAYINRQRHVPLTFTANELRDALQENRLGEAAKQKLASDVNISVMEAAVNGGTIVVKNTGANNGFASIAGIATAMSRNGVDPSGRNLALSMQDYNDAALSLIGSARSFDNETSVSALREARLGRISNIDTYMLDYTLRLTAAAGGGGITVNTTLAGGNRYVPAAREVVFGSSGAGVNKDNRYQDITVSSTTNVKAGDAFTIAGVEEVHHITKQSTGVLKTFRVMAVKSATVMTISPPLIDSQGPSKAEKAYGNVFFAAPVTNAAIVWLNTASGPVSPFWVKDSIEVLPARIAVPEDAGMLVMRATTASGFEVVMTKQTDINTHVTKIRFDTRWGVANLQPEMNGIALFNQV